MGFCWVFFVWEHAKFWKDFWARLWDGRCSLQLNQISRKSDAYLGSLAVISAQGTVDEIILKDVWFGFSFFRVPLPTQVDLLIWLL